MLLDVASINAKKGATVVTTTSPSFTPTAASSTSVTFGGSGTVSGTVSGPKGSGSSTDTLSGPLVVERGSSGWVVSSFVVDGRPMVEWMENTTQTQGGISVKVGAILSYGAITVALIGVGAGPGNTNVTLQSAVLTNASGPIRGTGNFTGPPTPIGVLRFSRVSGSPTALDLTFATGSGAGSTYHFVLAAKPT
ncbi:MAG: hypothetical protein ACYCV7_09780 [Acidimicrobiales bacterium]